MGSRERIQLTIGEGNNGCRLDSLLSESFPDISRSRFQKIIASKGVTVNGQVKKANYNVRPGDVVIFFLPEPEEISLEPEFIPLDIIFEDADVIVINKPRGLVVHPAPGNPKGTLVNALLYHCTDLSGINGKIRPGIVHRLDKGTSGIIVAAKNDFSHRSLAEQMKEHSIKRTYAALVHGRVPQNNGIIDAPIGRNPNDRKKMAVVFRNSRAAVTTFKVMERFKEYSLLDIELKTGRTHQIRVHMSYIGYPVVGDTTYGKDRNNLGQEYQVLHARLLGFVHPRSGEYMEFCTDTPDYMHKIIDQIRTKE